jgi:HD-like signal output (HDOD) protein
MSSLLPDILDEIKNLEPLPEVAARVLELSSRQDVVPGELVAVIQTDVAMTAKVLRLTNSAYYGFQREIASIHEAGNLLGVSVLVNLVLTACTGRYFRRSHDVDSDATRHQWERSVENALAASLLARLLGGVDKNRAYTAGLLQDLGMIVLDRFLRARAQDIARAVDGGMTQVDAERSVLGLDHAEAGARLAERWSFPAVLVDTIRFHHEPERATQDPMLALIVHIADDVVAVLRAGRSSAELSQTLQASALSLQGLDARHIAELAAELERELQQAREFVALT